MCSFALQWALLPSLFIASDLMGLFAFRRRQEREAASQEAASFHIPEPAPKLELKPKSKRRTAKPIKEALDGDHD
jgi:hypothetical protein